MLFYKRVQIPLVPLKVKSGSMALGNFKKEKDSRYRTVTGEPHTNIMYYKVK